MKEKILKLLQQTTTDSDNEALIAIRKANVILKKKDLHWDEFFSIPNSRKNNEKEIALLKDRIKLLERQVEFYKSKEFTSIKNPHIGEPNAYGDSEREDVDIEEKIEICLEEMPYNAFLHSLSDIWKKNGRISSREMKTLNVIYFHH